MPAGFARTDRVPIYRYAASANNRAAIPENLGILVPAQWARPPSAVFGTGEARLGAAILREAWWTLCKYPRRSRPYRDAFQFLTGRARTAPVSLDLACTLAGIDPEPIRRAAWAQHHARHERH